MRVLDGVWGGDQSFEVLKRGGLHLVVTEVVPVAGGADKKRVLVHVEIESQCNVMCRHCAWLYNVHRTCVETAAVSRGTSHIKTRQGCNHSVDNHSALCEAAVTHSESVTTRIQWTDWIGSRE